MIVFMVCMCLHASLAAAPLITVCIITCHILVYVTGKTLPEANIKDVVKDVLVRSLAEGAGELRLVAFQGLVAPLHDAPFLHPHGQPHTHLMPCWLAQVATST